jgi:flagellar L-ring protein precursor FlgH
MKRISLTIAALAVFSGCASTPDMVKHDPAFAPARPVPASMDTSNPGSLFQPGFGNLYTDSKAYRVGDILTVSLSESTNATKSATTTTAKSNAVDIANPTILGSDVSFNKPAALGGGTGDLSLAMSSDTSFSGEGESAQSNSLTGNITVSVVEVLANGYLVVRGEKILSLNQGDEFVRLSGIIRPEDISTTNTVQSSKIANAQIIYGGSGTLADANTEGWLSGFLKKIWPF